MSNDKIYVGTDHISYPQIRNFIGLPFEKYKHIKTFNLFKIPDHLIYRMFDRTNKFYHFSHYDSINKKVKLYHFFDTISFGRKPWVTTFETFVPYWDKEKSKLYEFGIKKIASSSCIKLIAISKCSHNIMKEIIQDNYYHYYDEIEDKISVLHPAQKLLFDNYDEKEKFLENEYITFTFVGSSFWRKGGGELLKSFDKLLDTKYPIKLNIISKLDTGDYITKSDINDRENALKIISKHQGRIQLFSYLSNDSVLDMLKKTHVCVLPTLQDSYGYFVLEAQAAGCPVITTDIRALSEINNNEAGWLIKTKKMGSPQITTNRTKISELINIRLESIIKSIVENPNQIKQKGIQSINRIRECHNPYDKVSFLGNIYDEVAG